MILRVAFLLRLPLFQIGLGKVAAQLRFLGGLPRRPQP